MEACEETNVNQTYYRRESWGGADAAMGDCLKSFIIFWKKNSYFNVILITFRALLEPFERSKFLRFESQLKKIKLFSFFFAYISLLKLAFFG